MAIFSRDLLDQEQMGFWTQGCQLKITCTSNIKHGTAVFLIIKKICFLYLVLYQKKPKLWELKIINNRKRWKAFIWQVWLKQTFYKTAILLLRLQNGPKFKDVTKLFFLSCGWERERRKGCAVLQSKRYLSYRSVCVCHIDFFFQLNPIKGSVQTPTLWLNQV